MSRHAIEPAWVWTITSQRAREMTLERRPFVYQVQLVGMVPRVAAEHTGTGGDYVVRWGDNQLTQTLLLHDQAADRWVLNGLLAHLRPGLRDLLPDNVVETDDYREFTYALHEGVAGLMKHRIREASR